MKKKTLFLSFFLANSYLFANSNTPSDNLITKLLILDSATRPIVEPRENRNKPFDERIKLLQERVNTKINAQRYIYLHKEEFLSNALTKYKAKRIISEIEKEYNIIDKNDAKHKLQPIPISLSAAQAILESGWGKSRYFREFNNPYGIYKGKKIKSFKNVAEAVEFYSKLLNSSEHYKKFRTARSRGDNIINIAKTLSGVFCEKSNYHLKLKPFLLNIFSSNKLNSTYSLVYSSKNESKVYVPD